MKKGFTLIELLAVIVILALVALISVPLVLGVIKKVQISSYKESLRSVFSAADLYIAGNEFEVFPDDGINVMDDRIQMKNKNFTSGKILKNEDGILELDKVSNGKYCAGGTYKEIIIIEGSCDQLDTTPPILSITSNLVTSSSITILATAEDLESGINGYQFSKDDGVTWTPKQISNVYNFTGLTNNTNYTFKVKVYNNNELSTVSEQLVVRTSDIPLPTYSITPDGWTDAATVTIYYPIRLPNYVYEYSLDNALTWEEVHAPNATKELVFTDNGSVIARITDGTNVVSGTTYHVMNIDTIPPIITLNGSSNLTIELGSNYNELGAFTDDGSSIEITGSVDTHTPGSYVIRYNSTDQFGNIGQEVTREVIVNDYLKTYMENNYINPAIAAYTGSTEKTINSLIGKDVIDPITKKICQKAVINGSGVAEIVCDSYLTINSLNLVLNYDNYYAHRVTDYTITNGIHTFITTSDVSSANFAYFPSNSCITSDTDLYYYYTEVKGEGYINIKIGNTFGPNITDTNNQFVTLTQRSTKSNQSIFSLYFRTPNTTYSFKNTFGFNITQLYGNGNEPTIEQLDNIIRRSI
jgi:prepilin-type N-terminal cleavage/methylation domain-containing protein